MKVLNLRGPVGKVAKRGQWVRPVRVKLEVNPATPAPPVPAPGGGTP